ncbi:hypothetical protein LX32DRAFT_141975 [Colletotrichum zoysiae]|uniref:Uncharacterized protein n=1 Tax=Colletotrichum zoysiae TaxID=1216348 RepID=A0AAD9H7C4_9PEZI|nr:hypothetical protein LX32DRAFT_141975 [Colletotrichum zoysiae]
MRNDRDGHWLIINGLACSPVSYLSHWVFHPSTTLPSFTHARRYSTPCRFSLTEINHLHRDPPGFHAISLRLPVFSLGLGRQPCSSEPRVELSPSPRVADLHCSAAPVHVHSPTHPTMTNLRLVTPRLTRSQATNAPRQR